MAHIPLTKKDLTAEQALFYGRLCEQTDRFDDMAAFMSKFVQKSTSMTPQQRNMVSVAFKQKLKPRRDSWRSISAMRNKEELKGNAYLREIEEM